LGAAAAGRRVYFDRNDLVTDMDDTQRQEAWFRMHDQLEGIAQQRAEFAEWKAQREAREAAAATARPRDARGWPIIDAPATPPPAAPVQPAQRPLGRSEVEGIVARAIAAHEKKFLAGMAQVVVVLRDEMAALAGEIGKDVTREQQRVDAEIAAVRGEYIGMLKGDILGRVDNICRVIELIGAKTDALVAFHQAEGALAVPEPEPSGEPRRRRSLRH
jgi:hypothetical protein